MKKLIFVIFIFTAYSIFAKPVEKNPQLVKEKEFETLKLYLESARDSLQNEIAARWKARQVQIEQREQGKEELTEFREKIERAHTELARLKEECFAKEGTIEEESKVIISKQDELKFFSATIDDICQKDADVIIESFPADVENKKFDIEKFRREFKRSGNIDNIINQYFNFKSKYIDIGATVTLDKNTVISSSGEPVDLNYIRFGNFLAYGMSAAGDVYMIRQTGRLGNDKYSAEKIESNEISELLKLKIPEWIKQGKPSGLVTIDVMQNEQSKILISGKKVKWYEDLWNSWKQGGAVMIPILLLPFWGFFLLIYKMIHIYGRKARFSRQFKQVMKYLDSSNYLEAMAYCKKQKGLMARVFEMCIERRERGRHGCEQVARELIFHEIPKISKSINTMAVIAGAAPLLGLLGTISGMITLFAAVTHYGTGDPKFLAGGISEALITAKTGLAIAIPALFLHDFLRSSKDGLLAEIEHYTSHILNKIWPEG